MGEVRTAEVLILDDLGAERCTKWAREKLYRLVSYRYQQDLPIVASRNLTPDDLTDELGVDGEKSIIQPYGSADPEGYVFRCSGRVTKQDSRSIGSTRVLRRFRQAGYDVGQRFPVEWNEVSDGSSASRIAEDR